MQSVALGHSATQLASPNPKAQMAKIMEPNIHDAKQILKGKLSFIFLIFTATALPWQTKKRIQQYLDYPIKASKTSSETDLSQAPCLLPLNRI